MEVWVTITAGLIIALGIFMLGAILAVAGDRSRIRKGDVEGYHAFIGTHEHVSNQIAHVMDLNGIRPVFESYTDEARAVAVDQAMRSLPDIQKVAVIQAHLDILNSQVAQEEADHSLDISLSHINVPLTHSWEVSETTWQRLTESGFEDGGVLPGGGNPQINPLNEDDDGRKSGPTPPRDITKKLKRDLSI